MVNMPQGFLGGPAAWKGADLQDSTDWEYQFSRRETDELLAALERVRELPVEQITPRNFLLPVLGPSLKAITTELDEGRGFILFRGLPVEDLELDDIKRMYYGMSTHLGIPIAQNSKGDVLGSVRNEGRAYGRTTRAYQSNVPLTFHRDSGDLVGLACVRTAKSGGISRIVSATRLHDEVAKERPDLLEVLYREPFYFSWKGEEPEGQMPYYWGRIFSWHEGKLTTLYSNRLILETQEHYADVPRLTDEQVEALELIESITARPEMWLDMDFRPGDVQYLSNHTVWHSRTAFEDYDDPALRRHLLRVWLAEASGRHLAHGHTNRYECVGAHGVIPRTKVFDVPVPASW